MCEFWLKTFGISIKSLNMDFVHWRMWFLQRVEQLCWLCMIFPVFCVWCSSDKQMLLIHQSCLKHKDDHLFTFVILLIKYVLDLLPKQHICLMVLEWIAWRGLCFILHRILRWLYMKWYCMLFVKIVLYWLLFFQLQLPFVNSFGQPQVV